jgi:hypothetical protein
MLKPYFAVSNGLTVNTFEYGTSERVPGDESLSPLSRQMMRRGFTKSLDTRQYP